MEKKCLIDADLFKINQEVLAIDGGPNFWNMPPNDCFLSQTHSLRNEFGSILYEAQATLFFLNSQDVMDQNLLNAILLLPKTIQSALGQIEEKEQLSTPFLKKNLDAAQELCSTFLLWPLIDLEALASGQEMCFNLVHSSNYEGIASKLTQFVQHFSSQSSFPLLFF
jgi:hypothetical protein